VDCDRTSETCDLSLVSWYSFIPLVTARINLIDFFYPGKKTEVLLCKSANFAFARERLYTAVAAERSIFQAPARKDLSSVNAYLDFFRGMSVVIPFD